MSGRILIIDDVPTNRIVLKVQLGAACHDIVACDSSADALAQARVLRPRLVILDCDESERSALETCAKFRADGELSTIPIIVTGNADSETETRNLRLSALAAGADVYMPKPLQEDELLARIRTLMRVHEVSDELRMRGSTSRALGFSEDSAQFLAPAHIALIAGDIEQGQMWRDAVAGRTAHRLTVLDRQEALHETSAAAPDIYVVAADLSNANEGLQLISELRSRHRSRHAAVLTVLPERDGSRAAMALDLGAADLISEPVDGEELALRLNALASQKAEGDRLRRQVRDGLRLAVTDPLTGLFNRRYALSHLARIRETSALGGQRFAVMVLDLDRFKRVNDTHGHAAGDAVLREVANRLAGNLRSVDLLARIGGEEFLVAMPDTTVEEAQLAAMRLCRLIESEPIVVPAPLNLRLRQTVSIGVAIGGGDPLGMPVPDREQAVLEALIDRADRALMSSKALGRNRVTLGQDAA